MRIYIQKNDIHSTLTTWIYCAFHMMWTAEHTGDPYINWPKGDSLKALEDNSKFAEIPNMYEWYFEQPFSYPWDNKKDPVWTWEKPGWGHGIEDKGFISQPLSVIKAYYQKHLCFNRATNARGEQLVNKYNIDFSKTIGITWRGTDIYLDGRPRLPIELYFPFIDDILNENPDYRIMCTAEETGILDPLFKHYPQAFLVEEFVSAPLGAKDNPEKLSSRLSGYEKGLQPTLMVWLFSKCAYYIKNRSSTGAVASWMSTGNIISLGHPETLGYESFGDYYEINGERKTPLYK